MNNGLRRSSRLAARASRTLGVQYSNRPMTPDELVMLNILNNPRNANVGRNTVEARSRLNSVVDTHTNSVINTMLQPINQLVTNIGPGLLYITRPNLTDVNLNITKAELIRLFNLLDRRLNILTNFIESYNVIITNNNITRQLTHATRVAYRTITAIHMITNELATRNGTNFGKRT